MRSLLRALGPAFLLIGALLLAESLATGGARLYLLLIIPVVTGTTPLFVLSVVFLVVGFLFLPLAFIGEEGTETEPVSAGPPAPASPTVAGGSGGLILVGPIPIFFGAWRRNAPISYRWAVVLGVVLAVVALLLLWGFSAL
jgi:uncharacterized membrane protein